MEPKELSMLSRKVDELIVLCNHLRQENRILRAGEHAWKQERAQLIERNEMARTKVEAMIGRLRALEQET
ncbi:TIGR02449 family protein [Kistimonas asteriae]|uniref:TIGR02449 family protein n=1 Tax=Kistimonas asteriae TaxID=517724 RepID=UPI000A0C4A51|nr:TIGR02449 family protein [Kistimonas asteriae]OQX38505.1 MAG: TIGR02449 family protein [Oceanospirillales bacterium LUC14_002_19_P2]